MKKFPPLISSSVSFGGGVFPPQTELNTTPPSPKTEITDILFYILNLWRRTYCSGLRGCDTREKEIVIWPRWCFHGRYYFYSLKFTLMFINERKRNVNTYLISNFDSLEAAPFKSTALGSCLVCLGLNSPLAPTFINAWAYLRAEEFQVTFCAVENSVKYYLRLKDAYLADPPSLSGYLCCLPLRGWNSDTRSSHFLCLLNVRTRPDLNRADVPTRAYICIGGDVAQNLCLITGFFDW